MIGIGADVLIIGASTRAAGAAAMRAGFRPLCLDMFADRDLSEHISVQRVENYPEGLIDCLRSIPPMPLVYVGGLENHSEVLQVAEECHELWGNSRGTVAKVRDLNQLAEVLRIAQVKLPEWVTSEQAPLNDGSWLIRPQAGSGGWGISRWAAGNAHASFTQQVPHYFQKYQNGQSYSATFIADPKVGDIRFVGVSRQLIGLSDSNATEFQWCGNVAPATLPVPIEHKLRRIGNVLKWKFQLSGLFGVDFLVDDQENIYVTEVNPRCPASLELLEFVTGQALFEAHARCYRDEIEPPQWTHEPSSEFYGRAILYAPDEFTLTTDLSSHISDYRDVPEIADIPAVGQQFRKGDPVCSVYAHAGSLQSVEAKLNQNLRSLQTQLIGHVGQSAS